MRVNKGDGTEVRLLHESQIPQLAEFKLSTPELLQVKARDGFVMEAMMIKPPDFNPARKYPVMQFTMLDFTTETLPKPATPRPTTDVR